MAEAMLSVPSVVKEAGGTERTRKILAFVLATLAVLSVSSSGELTPVSMGVIGLGFVVAWFRDQLVTNKRRSRRVATLLIVLFLVIQIARSVVGEPPLALGIELGAAIIINRLFARDEAADDGQLVLVVLLTLAVATVLSEEIWFGIYFLVFCILAPPFLGMAHFAGVGERMSLGHQRSKAVPRKFIWGFSLLAFPMLLGTAVFFLVFPRIGVGFITLRAGGQAHVAGFGNDVELGQVGTIAENAMTVFRARPVNVPASPEAQAPQLRFRGATFDRYDGRRWVRTLNRPTRTTGYGRSYFLDTFEEGEPTWEITLERLDESALFLPFTASSIRLTADAELGHHLVGLESGDFRYLELGNGTYRYSVYTHPGSTPAPRAPSPEQFARFLQIPEGHDAVVELAARWASTATSDADIAQALLSRLRSPAYTYSLDMPDPEGRMPLETFLLHAKRGHCEYFASAYVILARARGVPARLVTGFLGGQWNPFGGYFTVSADRAHSWAEVYLAGRGWVTVDPTPSGRSRGGAQSWLGEAIDAVRTWWTNQVVGYDLRSQRSAIERLFETLRQMRGRQQSATAPNGAGPQGQGATVRSLVMVLALTTVLWVLYRLLRMFLRRRRTSPLTRSQKWLAELERLLMAAAIQRLPHETTQNLLQKTTEKRPDLIEPVRAVTNLYEMFRFGASPSDEADVAAFTVAKHFETIRARLRGKATATDVR